MIMALTCTYFVAGAVWYLRTSEWHLSRHRNGSAVSVVGCRRRVWSSPRSLSTAAPRARCGVSQGWISRLVARYRAEGEAALEPRSRRPRTSPAVIPAATVELIVRVRKELAEDGLDAGPDTLVWHLRHHHDVHVSPATVARYLARAGLVVAAPKKRPRSSYIRFQAELPNECWQSDVTHYPLADGTGAEILSWIDDHARYALSVTAHVRVTGPIVATTFAEAAAEDGIPASTLTDIQSGCAALRLARRPVGEDRCRPAPARHRCLTEWSAWRLLAC
jgi:transposase InsO family protein